MPLSTWGTVIIVLYFQKPYTLSCSDQLFCTYIARAFALEGQLKVGTSLILGLGGDINEWEWYGHLQFSGILQICCAGQVINRYNYLLEAPYFYSWKRVFSGQISTKTPHIIYLNYKQRLICLIKQK